MLPIVLVRTGAALAPLRYPKSTWPPLQPGGAFFLSASDLAAEHSRFIFSELSGYLALA
jgi:hypothetical protein